MCSFYEKELRILIIVNICLETHLIKSLFSIIFHMGKVKIFKEIIIEGAFTFANGQSLDGYQRDLALMVLRKLYNKPKGTKMLVKSSEKE